MRQSRDSLNTRIQDFADSNWEDSIFLRWLAQLAIGAVPGLLVLVGILHLANNAGTGRKQGMSVASIIPLLSANAMANHPSFHRLTDTHPVALAEVQFRVPDVNAPLRTPKRVLTVVKKSSPLTVNFKAPRQSWSKLDAGTRQVIDAAQPTNQGWQRVVLHGSGAERGSATLMSRYQTMIQRRTEGAAYHFVIGNGQGAGDGQIEVTDRWRGLAAQAAGAESSSVGAVPAARDAEIRVCLVGDFQQRPPTTAQLQALDELLDYLNLKLGSVPVMAHSEGDDSSSSKASSGRMSRCLGGKFPLEQVLGGLGE